MPCKHLIIVGLFLAVGCALLSSVAIAEPPTDAKAPSGQPDMRPPGWTDADMQACMAAATPGQMHQYLAKSVGIWHGKSTMWMAPDTDPIRSECTSTISLMFDGRFIKCEMSGEMPGMGPFSGLGMYGFDNVTQKFQCSWMDSMNTTMLTGTGELSPDGKVMTWTYHYTCPITKKPVSMREAQTTTGENTKTLEMFGIDPKSGKEFKMMQIELTRS